MFILPILIFDKFTRHRIFPISWAPTSFEMAETAALSMLDQSSWRAVQEKKRAPTVGHSSLIATSSSRLAEQEAKARIMMVVSLMPRVMLRKGTKRSWEKKAQSPQADPSQAKVSESILYCLL